MDFALCTINEHRYDIRSFNQLDEGIIGLLRQALICPTCRETAFYRRESRNGRAPCFGAHHSPGCELAAIQAQATATPAIAEESNRLLNDGQHLILDLQFGAIQQTGTQNQLVTDITAEIGTTRRHSGSDSSDRSSRRRPGGLLRNLIQNPEFARSDRTIEVPNLGTISVRDFFVPFDQVNENYIGLIRGYWGRIPAANRSAFNSQLWLNLCEDDPLSIPLRFDIEADLRRRYGLNRVEDIVDRYALVIGTLKRSGRGRFYIPVDQANEISIRRY